MSVNIMFSFMITNIADEAQAKSVTQVLDAYIREENLEKHEVGLGWAFDEGVYFVSGETDYPLSISRAYLWRPMFERTVKERVADVAPAAVVEFSWRYPDEEE